jgi:hypothetical protein
VWSDVLQHAERLHLLRLCLWGAIATVASTGVLIIAQARQGSALLRRFAWVCGLLGLVELLVASVDYRSVPLRDISGATRLDRLAWLQLGLYFGLLAVGVTIVASSRVLKMRTADAGDRSLQAEGAGVAIALHGLALVTLELLLIGDISR